MDEIDLMLSSRALAAIESCAEHFVALSDSPALQNQQWITHQKIIDSFVGDEGFMIQLKATFDRVVERSLIHRIKIRLEGTLPPVSRPDLCVAMDIRAHEVSLAAIALRLAEKGLRSPSPRLTLEYVDDEGDKVKLSSDRELKEAIRIMKRLNGPHSTLTFRLTHCDIEVS
jgi:hypothetical protein